MQRGRHKRAKAAEAEAEAARPSPATTCNLLQMLLVQWATGEVSAQQVQAFCLQAYNDQVALLKAVDIPEDYINPDIKKVASLGKWGQAPNHIDEGLKNFLGAAVAPTPIKIKVPCIVQKKKAEAASKIAQVDFPIIAPHVAFAFWFHEDKTKFEDLFLGGLPEDARAEFWAELERRGDPRLQGHPLVSRPEWKTKAVPLSLHGDGVPVLQVGKPGSKSFEAYNFQSIWATGSSLKTKTFMFGVFGGAVASADDGDEGDTFGEIWKVLTWSLHYLWLGVWPRRDHNGAAWPQGSTEAALGGTPLAGGMYGVLMALKGDLDYFAHSLGLKHYNCNEMC
eukprot:15451247-Alexandrium_andersonii.AAC.1